MSPVNQNCETDCLRSAHGDVYKRQVGESGDNIEMVKTHGIPKYFCGDQDYLGLRVITLSQQLSLVHIYIVRI